jgi:hypothetical protein
MRFLAWIDGRVVEAKELPSSEPFVMQRIHTLNHTVYNAYAHIDVLRETSGELFGFQTLASGGDVERIVAKLLDVANAPLSCSVPVVMRIYASGALSFEVEQPMFGEGVYLRAKRPTGVAIERAPLVTLAPTSESEAAEAMAERSVYHMGGDVALWVDGEGNLISHPWRPLFVYHKGYLFTPKEYSSVEYISAVAAINSANMKLVVRNIPSRALESVEEIFLVDIMGVSSLANIRRHRLLSSIALRIANRMEPQS